MAEIERKFRLCSLPSQKILPVGVLVEQGYIFVDQGELRLRKKGGKCYLTVKGEGELAREEWETEIPNWVFEALWGRTQGRRVNKTRYTVRHQVHVLEIDEYHGPLSGLVTLECEFLNETTAREFLPPAWAIGAQDVTTDKRFKNKALAVNGIPPVANSK